MGYSHKPGGWLGPAERGFWSSWHMWRRAPPTGSLARATGPKMAWPPQASLHATASRPNGLAQASWKQLASGKENTEVVSPPFKAWSWKPQNVAVATSYRRKPSLEAGSDSRGRESHAASLWEAWPWICSHH